MRILIGLLAMAAVMAPATPVAVWAQSDRNVVSQALHDCTFSRPCNWTSHAAIAFGTTYALRALRVPTELAAGRGRLDVRGQGNTRPDEMGRAGQRGQQWRPRFRTGGFVARVLFEPSLHASHWVCCCIQCRGPHATGDPAARTVATDIPPSPHSARPTTR